MNFFKIMISAFRKYSYLLLFTVFLIPFYIQGQTGFEVLKYHGQGYSTGISSVTDNGNNSYSIVLSVVHDGCGMPECQAITQYSVEALAGTYSNISASVVSGNFSYGNVNYGPVLSRDPFQGFRLESIQGIGNGQAGEFTLSFTITGGLQNQQTLIRTSNNNQLIVNFTIADFQSFLDNTPEILPYYAPPEDGKILTSLIGAELTSLYDTYNNDGIIISNDIFEIVDSNVMIEISAKEDKYYDLLTLLQTPEYGLTDVTGLPEQLFISGLFPVANLLLLNSIPTLINFVRPVFPAIGNGGIVTSQGDTALRSNIARNAFNLTGEGIKAGVISDSYNTQFGNPAGDDVLRKDLPGLTNPDHPVPVEVLAEYPYGSRSDEGRAMLQIIHDVAPEAELAFRTGFKGAADFANGIKQLQQAGCDIIVDDITYITEPFLQEGIVAQAVEEVVSQGTAYFSSAGNFGNKSYQSNFSPSAPPSGISGLAHDFNDDPEIADIYQSVSLSQGNYTIVLQWYDGSGSLFTSTDLDIYLAASNETMLFGFNRISNGGYPVEVLPFTVTGDTATTNIMVIKASGSSPVYFKYVVFRGDITFNEYSNTNASTIVGHANASGAIAVGAVLYSNTPEYGVNPPTPASFSSRGGTPVDGIVRMKPDFMAPNGGNTTVDLGGFNIDGDLFPNFFGTSAAAPHAAGVAALIMEARAKYYNTSLSPDSLKAILQRSAIDMDIPGHDLTTGFGLIQADAALLDLANPSPVITSIVYDTNFVPGTEPLEISVIGNYLTSESQIYFNGLPLDSGTVLVSDTLITGTIPVFSDLYPPIQVYNPPLPQTNGTDGGLSNPLYFFSKKTIVISIDDKVKKYGETLPEFTAGYAVETTSGSLTLEEEGLTENEIDRITGISFTTIADALSNTGLWEIIPVADDPLNPDSGIDPVDSTDIALLNNYNFIFENGLLQIEKMDLLIIPKDTTFTYGDTIGGFEFYYIFNNDTIDPGNNVVINPQDSADILTLLQDTHATALVNATAFVRATALVNSEGEPLLDATALINKSIMISEATVLANATALVNGTLIDPEALYNATALVNTITAKNNTAFAPATALVNATAIVNTYDEYGNLLNETALVNASALKFATALVNASTINANSNSDAIVILGEGDIQILSGDSIGDIAMRSINLVTGNTVGQHLIVPGAYYSNNFNLTYGLGTLNILPAAATVEADTKIINAGAPLPEFTSSFTGFLNGETDTVLTSLSYAVNPTYSGATGSYQIIPTASADNYDFTSINGTLYVNPYGPYTRYITIKSVCIEYLIPPDSNGFSYLAKFHYTNNNTANVYIPVGPDNYLSGQGSYNSSQQPELFLANGGVFTVPFNGTKVTWTIRSNDRTGGKTTESAFARSSTKRCAKASEAEEQEIMVEADSDLKIYPNPVKDKVFINLGEESLQVADVRIYDIYAKHFTVSLNQTNSNILEIDMTGLKAGMYFIKVNLQTKTEVFRVIKI